MKPRMKSKSNVADAKHKGFRDLHKAGFIDMKKMKLYGAVCLAPIPNYSPSKIRALRSRHQLSQEALAGLLNANLSAVLRWERGLRKPVGPSAKLLNLLDRKGIEALT
jgi:putative transcriptional regulator